MNELPSQPEWNDNPYSSAEDIRQRHDWSEIRSMAAAVDQSIARIESETDALEASEWQLDQIRQQIGEGYEDGLAVIEGYGYRVEYDEYDNLGIGQQRINSGLQKIGSADQPQPGRYEGCELHWVNDRWRVLLMVDIPESGAEFDDGLYGFVLGESFLDNDGVIRDHVAQLELCLDDEKDSMTVGAILAQIGDDATELVRYKQFIRASAADQRALLGDICGDAARTVGVHFDGDVVTVQLQGVYHDMITWMNSDELIAVNESSQGDALDECTLTGTYSGFTYVELRDTPQTKKLSRQDFSIGNGAPCLVLIGDGVVHYVPAMQVRDIAHTSEASGNNDVY